LQPPGFSFLMTAMDRRALFLPVVALVIAGLVVWRVRQDQVIRARPRPIPTLRNLEPAPSFLLTTQSGGRAKLAAYLGRTRLVLVFTGGKTPLAESPELAAVAEAQPAIAGGGVQVVVVTPSPPQEVRRVQESRGKPFPFPVLSDIDPDLGVPTPAHQLYGLVERPGDPPSPGLFLIDRAGYTEFTPDREAQPGQPAPMADPPAILRRLSAGEWPL